MVAVLVYQGLKVRHIPPMLQESITSSANVKTVAAFSGLSTWILALEQVPDLVAVLVLGLDLPLRVILPYSCIPGMGKPPFKASEGGRFDIFHVIGGFHFW